VIDFILHFDKHLLEFVRLYGTWVYGLLFAIVFAETGFVVTPFLPGDSLLFAAGALAATGVLNGWALAALLALAAFSGNAVNYTVGRLIGPRVFTASAREGWSRRLLNREHLDRAHGFFLEYGGKAVVLGRFVPIVRTFVPFVAGAATMPAAAFGFYNLAGALGWVGLCLGAGMLFGNVPLIKQNFSLVTIGIVVVSLLPMAIELARKGSRSRSKPGKPSESATR
jgi:membrane-associated protein